MPAPPSVRAVVVVAALMVLTPVGVQCQCRPNDGPAGNMVCISASQYENQSQFATCRTNSYVLRKSRGKERNLAAILSVKPTLKFAPKVEWSVLETHLTLEENNRGIQYIETRMM